MENEELLPREPICENGKSYLINPNLLFGQGVDDGISVAHEDLNIYVELTTSKKNRSIIDISNDNFEYTSTEKGKLNVSFIDGAPNGEFDESGKEKKSLTTSYTDLTTVFNKTADTEKFGITSIDIDFSTSYTPLVHIEFVDVRGASLFNTDQSDGKGPQSEYSSFFDLPYPIFQLKVKGYYGKAVKYCLHLTKWNARFNSKTGNFEISADFIGYTYALLSDLLLGYLRAITYTKMGATKFLEAKAEMLNPNELTTIKDLLDNIKNVNENISKIQSTDSDVKELGVNKELQNSIENIENLLKDGIKTITEPDDSSITGYALFNSNEGLIGVKKFAEDTAQAKTNIEDIKTWRSAMTIQVEELNKNISSENKFNPDDFAGLDVPKTYPSFNYNKILDGQMETNQVQAIFRREWGLLDSSNFNDFMTKRMATILNQKEIRNEDITIYDYSKIYKKIAEIKDNIAKNETEIKTNVALKIKNEFIDTLGFEPTIGSIFRIFTIHAEIFLECLREVSKMAETDGNGLRMAQLIGLKDHLDIHKTTSSNEGSLPSKIWAWPLYRKSSADATKGGVLEEAYLGGKPGVEIPQNVPELVFVEELMEALIKVAKDDKEREEALNSPDVIIDSWYPVNVLDTPLFGVIENPYKTLSIGTDSNNPLDPLRLMMMRAFTFLGISNRDFYADSIGEVKLMGILEANSCNIGIKNKTLKLSMIEDPSLSDAANAEKIIDYFLQGKNGERNVTFKMGKSKKEYGLPRPLFRKDGDLYKYGYINNVTTTTTTTTNPIPQSTFGPQSGAIFINPTSIKTTVSGGTAITFNGEFDGSEFYKDDGTRKSNYETKRESWLTNPDNGLVFTEPNYTTNDKFWDSGAILMKVFTDEEYNDLPKALIPQYVEQADSINEMLTGVNASQPEYVDGSDLAGISRDIQGCPAGFKILGNQNSKFSFTTIENIDMNNVSEINYAEKVEKAIPKIAPASGVSPSKAIFYISHASNGGTTSLSLPPIGGSSELESGTYKGIGGNEFYKVRQKKTENRSLKGGLKTPRYPEYGNNRELFNNEEVYIPNVEFVEVQRVLSDKTLGLFDAGHTADVFSLFGSEFYFEQRQSSSPKSTKALLFLHTLPWNQLYTDNCDIISTEYRNSSIFDNAESSLISNLFDRKSAFINAPYLWVAFIGGILWRRDTTDINYVNDGASDKDPSGKIPDENGGSGEWDPIIWGEKKYPTSSKSSILVSGCYLTGHRYVHGGKNELPYTHFPSRSSYLTSIKADTPLELDTSGKYKLVSETLLKLPVQIKREFKRVFFDFVNSLEWKEIREAYEMVPSTSNSNYGDWNKPDNSNVTWKKNGYNNGIWDSGSLKWKKEYTSAAKMDYPSGGNPIATDPLDWTNSKGGASTVKGIAKKHVEKWKNWVNYEYLQPIRKGLNPDIKDIDVRYNWDMAFRQNIQNKTLTGLFRKGVWIANVSYKPWVSSKSPSSELLKSEIYVDRERLIEYVSAFCGEWKKLIKIDNEKNEENELKQQVFNSMDNDAIRMNIYRHCKAVNDKWIAGSSGSAITACGQGEKVDRKIDNEILKLKRKEGSPKRFIDSFRFINRGFNDLSDTYLLNPAMINEIMTNNLNQSFYDLISRILADNNFNFISLPAYIDFNDKKDMADVFKTSIFNSDDVGNEISGPTFVCMYVGQGSNKLDLGNGSGFPNDGFDFKCGPSGQLEAGENKLPLDMSKEKQPHEHNVVAFAVNYGQQNQNIFTDVRLDQQEFSETDESLQITDSIANNGGQSSRTQAGQNLWNVYQVRSYSAEIESMGNVMIQPMMYFQLNNIPMFHGAYNIINTKHSIKPNHMTTTFKGVRTRFIDTPQVDADSLYMSMIGTLSGVDGISGNIGSKGYNRTTGTSGKLAPIVNTIYKNGGGNGAFTIGTGNIKSKSVSKINGINNMKLNDKNENIMLAEAVEPLEKMLEEFVTWLKANNFKGNNGYYAYITSIFRDYAKQVEIKEIYKGNAASPGSSPHGWGIAFDIQFLSKDGKIIKNSSKTPPFFKFEENPAIKWMYDNSYAFGFVLPYGLRDGKGLEEHWHFEYHGTAAKCLVLQDPNVYGYKIDTSRQIESIVTNPKDVNGKPEVYTGCKYTFATKVDGTEGCPAISKNKPFTKHSGYKNTIDKIINNTYNCDNGRDCSASFAGLKQVPELWSNGKLTKRGIIGMSFGVTEGFGTAPHRKNPGNLRPSGGDGYITFDTWKDGWKAFHDDKLIRWSNGKLPRAKSRGYADCYSKETNESFKESGVKFTEMNDYNYTDGSLPTLRQFINVYAPWGDNNNPSNYIAGVAKTLETYGHVINVDDAMKDWI